MTRWLRSALFKREVSPFPFLRFLGVLSRRAFFASLPFLDASV